MTAVIEISGLRKTFHSTIRRRPRPALDGFDMLVEAGQVHGFLGPNGSGKTTTLRILLGLVSADGGQMRLFGAPVPSALPAVMDRIGAIVESPRFFGSFTGRRTLELLATAGGVPRSRVVEVLTTVGMRDRADERVASYSLGMRQRLAVASALLKSPDLLILDEPANGLDPAGIREMRDLLRELAGRGVTVLISSHILAEIQLVCDTVTIVSRGRRVTAGPVTSVLARSGGGYRVRVARPTLAADTLRAAGASVTVERLDGSPARPYGVLTVGGVDDPARITEILAGQRLWVAELSPAATDLESAFLELTGPAPDGGRYPQIDQTAQPGDQAAAPGDELAIDLGRIPA